MRLKILVSAHFWNVKLGITFAGNAFLIKMATKNTVRRWISCFYLLMPLFRHSFRIVDTEQTRQICLIGLQLAILVFDFAVFHVCCLFSRSSSAYSTRSSLSDGSFFLWLPAIFAEVEDGSNSSNVLFDALQRLISS